MKQIDPGVFRELARGASDRYCLKLKRNDYLYVEIAQRGIDIYAELLGPTGRRLSKVDSHTGRENAEHLHVVVEEDGWFTLSVRAFESNPEVGEYSVRIVEQRPATEDDRRHVEAERIFMEAYFLAEESPKGALPSASVEGYQRAGEIWEELGKHRRRADAFYETGTLFFDAQRYGEAVHFYDRCLLLYSEPVDWRRKVTVLNKLAISLGFEGEVDRAQQYFIDARRLAREIGDVFQEATALTNLGRLQGRRGRPLQALETLRQAEELWQQVGDRSELAGAFNLIGEIYVKMGEAEIALDYHGQALELSDPRVEPEAHAVSLGFIGQALLKGGDLEGAADAYSECLKLRLASGDAIGQAKAWTGLGLIEERRGRPHEAIEHYRRALLIFEQRGAPLDLAAVFNNLAWTNSLLGEAQEALLLHGRALEIFVRLDHHEGEAASYFGIARAHRLLGQTAEALRNAEIAIAQIEEVLESGSARSDIDVPFVASKQDYFDLYIDLLMDQHRRHPKAEYDALALAASEQARSRHLLEILGDELAVVDRENQKAPQARRRALQEKINTADRELRHRRASDPTADLEEAERDLRRLISEFHGAAQEIRDKNPWQVSLHQPRTLALDEIRRLLDGDSLLLEYHLGNERSFLWAVSQKKIESYELPPRAIVEKSARRAYDLLLQSDLVTHRLRTEQMLEDLAEILLEPVASRLSYRRLLVVASGALSYIPFAALPVPATKEAKRLVEEHEIVYLPSASVLGALRHRSSRRSPTEGLLGIVADPVFSLAGRATSRTAPLSGGPFLRLLHSRREAEAILALAEGVGPITAALGFDAHRDLVLDGGLDDFRIVHFATHGVQHASHPELSALILSRFEENGKERNGRLPLHEVYDLQLQADLVVLSACRTALGEEIRGEGLVGLPHGFLYAGASRVLVSLWNVQDESTAELMTRFYRYLLVEKLSPAAALSTAQRSMLTEPRYAPYHWAGFILQGEFL